MKPSTTIFHLFFGVIFTTLMVHPCFVSAQNATLNDADIGILVSTNGLGFVSSLPLHLKEKRVKSIINFSFQTFKHPQEAKVQNLNYTNPKPYVFGKINQGTTLRLGYGLKKKLSENERGFPSISVQLSSGSSLGLLKPYFIRFDNPGDRNGTQTIQQNKNTSENQSRIVGPASWTKGFSKITSTAGIYMDMSININWDQSFSQKALTLGARADYFFKDLNILLQRNSQLFLSLFATYSLGKNSI